MINFGFHLFLKENCDKILQYYGFQDK